MNIDIKVIESLKDDVGAEVLPMVMASFVTELQQRAKALQAAIDQADLGGIQAQAHSVKSTARTVGLMQLGDLASEVDQQARDGELRIALQNAATLVVLCQQGGQLIEEFQKTI